MAIKVIVELQARPGKRPELTDLLESVAARLGPGSPGFMGSTRYEEGESVTLSSTTRCVSRFFPTVR